MAALAAAITYAATGVISSTGGALWQKITGQQPLLVSTSVAFEQFQTQPVSAGWWRPPDSAAQQPVPPAIRIAIVLDNYSPHLSTRTDRRVGRWAAANNVELAYTPTNASHLNRIEAQFTALRYFTLDGTDHGSHAEQANMIRRYITWRNRNAHDKRLKTIIRQSQRCPPRR
jgi:transposase